MYDFDKRLHALAGCPVIAGEGGSMVFSPNPVIIAENDPILAHEICHVLAGREDYEVFTSAVKVRTGEEVFRHILNMLYDWYHESLYGRYSGFLWSKLGELHKMFECEPTGIDVLDAINAAYMNRHVTPKNLFDDGTNIRDVVDLVALADIITEDVIYKSKDLGFTMADLMNLLGLKEHAIINGKWGRLGGPKSDIGIIPKRSSYYITAVSKYHCAIQELSNLWKKNKYNWINNYYGEINWKNLQGMFQGEMMNLPVWRLFQKIGISRKVYLAIDRSGSTENINHLIMDTTIIIAESLRMLGVSISILDVGVTDSVVNDIDDPLDIPWFTPMSGGGTPMGEVCSMVKKADNDSYLLVVTDGLPDNWNSLLSALNAFPGSNLTFVIGDSYGEYVRQVKNAIHVEPHTIIREMLHDATLG